MLVYSILPHIFYIFQIINLFWYMYGHSWRVRLAKQETLTPPGHLVSPLVCRGPWMSTVVLYCWCHSDGASVLLYFTVVYSILPHIFYIFQIINICWYMYIRNCHIYFTFSKLSIHVGIFDIATYILHFSNFIFMLVYSILLHIFYIFHIINLFWYMYMYIRYSHIYFTFSKLSIYVNVGYSILPHIFYIFHLIKIVVGTRTCIFVLHFPNYHLMLVYSMLPYILYICQIIT